MAVEGNEQVQDQGGNVTPEQDQDQSGSEQGVDKTALSKAGEDNRTALSKAADEGKGGDEDDGDEGAPEKYEDFTVPEGMELNPEWTGSFNDLAKESNLSQAQAQKFIDLQTKIMQENNESLMGQWDKMRGEWLEKSQADKEIGGTKFQDATRRGALAVREFGDAELSEVMETFGLGNHPAVLRFLSRVGALVKEDSVHRGQSQGQKASGASALFPSMKG